MISWEGRIDLFDLPFHTAFIWLVYSVWVYIFIGYCHYDHHHHHYHNYNDNNNINDDDDDDDDDGCVIIDYFLKVSDEEVAQMRKMFPYAPSRPLRFLG